jgi:cytochrome c peroxidase
MVLFVNDITLAAPSNSNIKLSSYCPPSFIKINNTCKLQTHYLQYASLQNAGVGGLKTGLPKYRDGFSPEQIDLGRYLFFDPFLSKDNTVSCASCHIPERGFSDGKARSVGINNHELPRNAPSLWNVGFLNKFFWDGRATSLEDQVQGPLYDPHEMGNTREGMLKKLSAQEQYRRLFSIAYPDSKSALRLDHIYNALTAFESSLISLNSRYDLYAQGFHDALNPEEIKGMNVFRSFVARCAECHTPPLFTNQQIAVIGVPKTKGLSFDVGSEKITNEPTQRGGFKVPSLRNVTLTAPYEHAGQFSNLHQAVEFYNKGRGHAVPKGENLSLHWHIWEPKLTATEINQLVAFLGTLTDESFRPTTPKILPSGLNSSVLNANKNQTTKGSP